MSREFKFEKDYYEEGINIYKKGVTTLEPGVTVLCGCNGSGKSTFLSIIKRDLKKNNVPVLSFDNLHDGGNNARAKAGFYGHIDFLATSICSSEGENIVMNLGQLAAQIGTFIRSQGRKTGDRIDDGLRSVLGDNDKQEFVSPTEYWILLDAIDSGLSIDNVIDVKEYLFKTIIDDSKSKDYEVYIVVSANEYEMCVGEQCFGIQEMKYIDVKSYEDFKRVVVKSREYKDSLYKDKTGVDEKIY